MRVGACRGIFAPALFIGATLGGSVAHLVPSPGRASERRLIPLVGMGAFFAGAIRAPMRLIASK